MPRLNDALQWTTGYLATWFSPTQTLRYNVPDGDIRIKLFPGNDLTGGGSPLTERIPVSHLYAASGNYCYEQTARDEHGNPVQPGVFVNGALARADAALDAYCDPVGPDGSVMCKLARDSYGPWGLIDGTVITEPHPTSAAQTPQHVCNYGNGKASWTVGNVLHTNFGDPHAGTRCYDYRLKGADFMYQSADGGALVFNGKQVAPGGDYYRPDFAWDVAAGEWLLVWSTVEGEPTVTPLRLTPAQLAALPNFPASNPDQPIGPIGNSRAADGRTYDVVSCLQCDPALQPRVGLTTQPTDTQHQVSAPDNLVHHVKFGNRPSYETWAWDDNWVYHLEDASGDPPYSFTDPRWWPRHLAIGEAAAFITGEHQIVHRQRFGCAELGRDPVNRKMWLHALWDQWNWGRNLGVRATMMLVYDNTAGFHDAGRLVEVFYLALNAGWCRWEAHRSDIVYAHGAAQFTDASRVARSEFYYVGGANIGPQLTDCVPQSCPHYPPPPPTPTTTFPAAKLIGVHMPNYLKITAPTNVPTIASHYVGADPHTNKVYYNRPGQPDQAGPWEEVKITQHGAGGPFDVLFVVANVQLSVDQYGQMSTRIAGTFGPDEQFWATTQPDGSNLLYRFQNGVLVPLPIVIEVH